MKSKLLILVVSALSFISGCVSKQLYEGPARPSEEIVRITGMSGLDPLGGNTSALVCRIDDKDIDGCAVKVEFLPGRHKLLLKTKSYGIEQSTIDVEQEFIAGDRYLLGISFSRDTRKMVPALIRDRHR